MDVEYTPVTPLTQTATRPKEVVLDVKNLRIHYRNTPR